MIRMELYLKLEEKGMTQQKVSELTGIRQPSISDYCNNNFRRISRENLNNLCKIFDCDVSDIIKYIPNNK